MRLSSTAVVTGMILTAVMVACSEPEEPDWATVCKDRFTDVRLDDKRCEDDPSGSGTTLVYFPRGYSAPAVGSKVSGGTTVRPATGTVGTFPASGGFGGFKGSSST